MMTWYFMLGLLLIGEVTCRPKHKAPPEVDDDVNKGSSVSFVKASKGKNKGKSVLDFGLDDDFDIVQKIMQEIDEMDAKHNGITNVQDIIPELYGGDMVLNKEEACGVLTDLAEKSKLRITRKAVREACDVQKQKKRPKRKALNFDLYTRYKWENAEVKYQFDETSFPPGSDNRGTIQNAMDEWERLTCITFQEVDDSYTQNRIIFQDDGSNRCYSYIGKVFLYKKENGKYVKNADGSYVLNPQPVNFGDNCFIWNGTSMHEIGHALGLVHEQARIDRDTYVDIVASNVNANYLVNFNIWSGTDDENIPYDLGSVMHYPERAFACPTCGKSIKAVDTLNYGMGQRFRISFADAAIIQKAYGCSALNPSCTIECLNDGMPSFKTNCDKCICPDGYTGTTCESMVSTHEECHSGEYFIDDPDNNPVYNVITGTTETCFTSPNFTGAADGGGVSGVECSWILKTNPTQRFRIRFHEYFSVYSYTAGGSKMCTHWVEIKEKGKRTSRGYIFCGVDGPTLPKFNGNDFFVSDQEEIQIIFNSNNQLEGFAERKSQFRICVVPI